MMPFDMIHDSGSLPIPNASASVNEVNVTETEASRMVRPTLSSTEHVSGVFRQLLMTINVSSSPIPDKNRKF